MSDTDHHPDTDAARPLDATAGHGAHGHSHGHAGGVRGFIASVMKPHSHDAADSIDSELEASAANAVWGGVARKTA